MDVTVKRRNWNLLENCVEVSEKKSREMCLRSKCNKPYFDIFLWAGPLPKRVVKQVWTKQARLMALSDL